MHRYMQRFMFVLLLALTHQYALATVYKCEQDGKVAYQASPCTNGSGISHVAVKVENRTITASKR